MFRIRIIIFLVGFMISSCQMVDDTTSENLKKYLDRNEITLAQTSFGGYVDQSEIKIKFIKNEDLVNVKVYSFGKWHGPSRELNISFEDFDEIKNAFHCLVENHHSGTKPNSAIEGSVFNEYNIETRFSKMNLFDLNEMCKFEDLLMEKLNHPNILDMINKFG